MARACKHSRLSAYLDGELSPEESARIEHHLAECAQCRARLRALERIASTLRQTGPAAPPPSTWTRPAGAVPTSRAAWRTSVWRWALACALAVAAILGARAGLSQPPAAPAGPVAEVRASVDFRNNQVFTVVSWSDRAQEPRR